MALWSEKLKFDINFGTHGCCIVWTKEERDYLACYQQSVQISAFVFYYRHSLCGTEWHRWQPVLCILCASS